MRRDSVAADGALARLCHPPEEELHHARNPLPARRHHRVYHRDIQDPDNGGGLTVKVYRSEKVADPDHGWQHQRITLACDTLEPGYADIVLEGASAGELQALGELMAVLDLAD